MLLPFTFQLLRHCRRGILILGLFVKALTFGVCWGDEPSKSPPPDYAAELPRFPPVEPDKALATFRLQPGFRMELVAAEPLVNSPVAVCWDERGRMFVVEMRGYSERRDEKLSRIRLLTDTNDDGVYDEAQVFADKLLWPTAICCWNGGVFVADAPDIWFLKDTDGDGKADERKRIYTGFGTGNVQGLLNTLLWGLDNRIHGATSSNGGEVRYVGGEKEGPAISLRGRDFSFDPRNPADIRPESGGGQHGMTFDDWGRKFVCSNSDHAQQIMFDDRYAARNPSLAAPPPRISIAADGPQAAVFRASPIEPWRVLRTRLRVAGQVPGPIEGGGQPAGYFTGATGITMIRGDAFDDTARGTLVVGDVGSNLVHRKRLRIDGLRYVAERIDKESELVASTDTWFRPAQFANGPDGALTIIDVYREVIEHPASLPPDIKKHLDLDSGRDRGRIYRLVPTAYKRRPQARLDMATTAELVALLGHFNAWHRETAARLLYERQDPEAKKPLVALVHSESASAVGKVHALGALAGFGDGYKSATLYPLLLAALRDKSPRVREWAIRLAELAIRTEPKSPFVERSPFATDVGLLLENLADDDDSHVRFQVALTQVAVDPIALPEALLQSIRRDGANPYMCWAVLSALQQDEFPVLRKFLHDPKLRRDRNLRPFLLQLAEQAGRHGPASNIFLFSPEKARANFLEFVVAIESLGKIEPLLMGRVAHLLLRELARVPKATLADFASAETVARLEHLRDAGQKAALRIATDRAADIADRLDAIAALNGSKFELLQTQLAAFLDPRESQAIQLAALQSLGEFREPQVAEIILRAWPGLSPAVRRAAGAVLVARPERATKLLEAIEQGKFAAAELDTAQVELLKAHPIAALRERAKKHFVSRTNAQRLAVLDAYKPALGMQGDAARGKAHFAKSCSACHRVENVGTELGPNLAAMRNRGPEAILLNVLDPNREVNPQYLTYLVTTRDGRTLTGLIAAETATSITLRQADGRAETILRENIEDFRGPSLSFMPEGLEKQLDVAAMADLVAYLMSVK